MINPANIPTQPVIEIGLPQAPFKQILEKEC